ncbi:stage II sporulation protein E [Thermosyntropha lipolytica DSM 11003]|uniref:Stage II sporulation protein E n=1 Tax=Thermosyntropha lipolytica DSM 11003 TaxID=1123382 RepID=A0A1M5JTX0_9FIRM|nr:stage II sporulation protein E [Thermosyntropha lipolytica]SHG43855.1 stage II sporulation protein E [Thermosyntropha lipolytica DSM 11003]
MLDRIEVYPYQRIKEPASWTDRLARKRKKKKRATFYRLPEWSLPARGDFLKELNWVEMVSRFFTRGNLLLATGAFLMARAFILGEILPFLFAFAAVFSRYRKEKAIIIGLCGSLGLISVLDGTFLGANILALLLLVGIINYINIPEDKAWWALPSLTVAILMVIKSVLNIAGGFSFYQEMVIIFEAIIAGILVFVFMVADDAWRRQKELASFTFEDICAFLVLGIGVVIGLEEVTVGGLSIAAVICRVGILLAALLWGSGAATMVGVMTGIIPSIASSVFAPTLGMYAVSGLLAGLFRSFGRLGIIIGFMLGTLALSMFIPETEAAVLGLWETGIACLIFFMLPSSLKEKLPVRSLGSLAVALKPREAEMVDIAIKEETKKKIEELAAVFEELSSSFQVENSFRTHSNPQAYLEYLYGEVANNFCRSCSRYDSCWGKNSYSVSGDLLDIFASVEINGSITYEECPLEFRRRCIYGREMVTTINYLFDILRLNEYWLEKVEQTQEIVAVQLKEVGNIIRKMAGELEIKTSVDLELKRSLQKESKKLGLPIADITPIKIGENKPKLRVVADACPDGKGCENNLSTALSSLIGEKMEVASKKCPKIMGKGRCEFVLVPGFTYKINTGTAQIGKEEVCGDTFILAKLDEGREVIILSDGMGVGERAYAESQAAVSLLKSLMANGFSQEASLKIVNSVLLTRSRHDSFATLDIAVVDLYNAQADFIKTGSAPTFIKRGPRVEVIEADTLPVGIIEDIEVGKSQIALHPYDMIVMVSDGILEASGSMLEGERWLKEFLSRITDKDPQKIAEAVLNQALTICEGKPRDDMTVICAYVDLNFA